MQELIFLFLCVCVCALLQVGHSYYTVHCSLKQITGFYDVMAASSVEEVTASVQMHITILLVSELII